MEDSLIVLDTLPEGYIRFDGRMRFAFLNLAAYTILRKTRTELLGRKLQDAFPSGTGTPLEACCRRVIEDGKPVTLEYQIASSREWWAITAMPDSVGGVVARFSEVTGQKLLEDELRISQEKFSRAFHSSPIPMCIVDVEKNSAFLEVNEAFERITGYSRGEVMGRTTAELGLYADPQEISDSRLRFLEDGGYREREVRFRRKDGTILIGLLSAEKIELGGKLCALAVAIDVTERRRTEQALRGSEELYRQLFDLESDVIVLVDRESGQLLAANAAATALYGYTKSELLSMNRKDLSAEPEQTVLATTRGDTFIPLRWHRKKDGTIFPVEICGTYFELKGRPVFVSAIRDITERLRMEEALRKSEERFFKAFHSNPAALTIVDLGTKSYLEVNESFEEMTGYSREEAAGSGPNELAIWADPDDRDRVYAQLQREGRLRNHETRFRKKNGEMGVGLLSADLIEIEGRPCAITATVDMTGRLQLEGQLRQAQRLESVGRLAGGVAHDFNNLLTVINGYSDFVLQAIGPPDPLYPHIHEIKRAGERAASLTSQLLAFSRKQVIEPRPLDLNSIVNDAERMLERLIGEDIELVTRLDPELGQTMADRGQMDQVIMNLAVNARDAMPIGGKLEITTQNVEVEPGSAVANPEVPSGKFVLLTVTDNGMGMDEHTLQNVFEPFFTTKEHGQGTGLGLSMVYGIVRQAGGWIDVRSTVGQGTSFEIYLPHVEAPQEPPVEPERPATLRGSETVLVVEDQEETRKLTTTILKAYGYHVLEAGDSSEAFRVEESYPDPIHLLLTDVILPKMNGKILSEQLRTRRPEIKVLFTSGYTEDVISRRGVLEQKMAYLPKPFSPDALASKVREVLGPARSKRKGRQPTE
jgi:PAS domain S-box-containing protein